MSGETRCLFEVASSPRPLQCRLSEGHFGPHTFIFVPGMDGATSPCADQLAEALRWKAEAEKESLERWTRIVELERELAELRQP